MKVRICIVLCVASAASCITVLADDTPEQAAARAALEQKIYELDHSATPPSPAANSAALVTKSAGLSAVTTNVSPPQAAASQTALPSTAPGTTVLAQTIALAAMKQKMRELNQTEAGLPTDTNAAAALMTARVANPVNGAANATPVTETPTAEMPAAISPAISPSAMAPPSVPAVAAPKVSIAPAIAAPVAVLPAVVTAPIAAPTVASPAAEPAAPRLPASSSEQFRPMNQLVTVSGVIYKNVEVEKVTSDGIAISYTPSHGGWAMTMINFQDLPAEIRQQYQK